MRVFASVLSLGLVTAVLAACSSDSHSPSGTDAGRDGGPAEDAGTDAGPGDPDTGPPDAGPTGAPVGAMCAESDDCQGPICVTPAMGFPGGYCTGLCDLGSPLDSCDVHGGEAICLEVGSPGMRMGACFANCDPRAMPSDCRDDYLCIPLGGGLGACLPRDVCGDGDVGIGEECEPPGEGSCDDECQGTGDLPVGSACESAADCRGDGCILDGFPGGYCTEVDCDLEDETSCAAFGDDATCVNVDMMRPYGVCFDGCDPMADPPACRPEYECLTIPDGRSVCVTAPVCGNMEIERGEECDPPVMDECSDTCEGFGTAPIGAACESAADCAGDACISEMDGWPGGYCSQTGCDLDDPKGPACAMAGGDGTCVNVGMPGMPFGICADLCNPDMPDCREGYTCMLFGGAQICAPTPKP